MIKSSEVRRFCVTATLSLHSQQVNKKPAQRSNLAIGVHILVHVLGALWSHYCHKVNN